MRSVRWLVLCAVLLAGPTGCITWFTDPMGHRAAFDEAQRRYTQLMRWAEIEKASAYVDPELRAEFLAQAPVFESLRITDFSIGEVEYEGDRAKVSVTYEGYSLETFVERKVREQQEWIREGGNRWRVRSNAGAFAEVLGEARH